MIHLRYQCFHWVVGMWHKYYPLVLPLTSKGVLYWIIQHAALLILGARSTLAGAFLLVGISATLAVLDSKLMQEDLFYANLGLFSALWVIPAGTTAFLELCLTGVRAWLR